MEQAPRIVGLQAKVVVVGGGLLPVDQVDDPRATQRSTVLGHHVLVAAEVASSQHHALACVVLGERAVSAFADNALHAPLGAVGDAAAHELASDVLIEDLPAGGLDVLGQRVDGKLLANASHRHVSADKGVRRNRAVGGRVKIIDVGYLENGVVALLGKHVEQPVHRLLAVVVELEPLAVVNAERVRSKLGEIELLRVIGLHALALHDLGVRAVVRATTTHRAGRSRNQDCVQATLGARARSRETSSTGAHNNQLAVDLLCDVGDRLGRDLEAPLLRRIRLCGKRRRTCGLVSDSSASRNTRGGGSGRGGTRGLNEGTARHSGGLGHERPLSLALVWWLASTCHLPNYEVRADLGKRKKHHASAKLSSGQRHPHASQDMRRRATQVRQAAGCCPI